LNHAARPIAVAALALAIAFTAAQSVSAKKSDATPGPSPSASASAAPLPTATPESPAVAVPRLEAKIKANPSDKDALQELAGYYLGEGRADQALALTQRLLSLGSKTAQVYYLDGIANQSLGRVKDATDDFEQATNQEPTNAQILLTLTNLYLQTNRAADAERVAKRATTFNPNDKRSFENYGLVLGQEGKFDDARTQFETASKLDPKDPEPIVLEARSYVSQKSLPLAAQLFDRALTVDPKDADALFGKASLQAVNHDVPGAIATYEQLILAEPNDDQRVAVLIEEERFYVTEKQNDKALDVLKRIEATYPAVAGGHVAYGDYDAAILKDTNAAEREWTTALGPDKNNPDALQRLGQLAASRNKLGDAIGFFKQLSVVQPNDPRAWGVLAQALSANRQFNDARDAYRRSFELARTPQALAGMGTSDLELKNYKECGQVFTAIDRNAADYMKQNPLLYYVYAKCSVANGDKTAARSAYQRFKPFVKPGTPLSAEVAKALQSLGGGSPTPKSTAKPKPAASGAH
jgi:tetratricopeptide (TPR) repeat protein